MYRLMRHGFKAYLVGGGVRDLLLQVKPKDFDIGTDARPRQIKAIFRNSRIIGRRFKLVHIYFQGNKIIEVATFRAQDSVPEPSPEPSDETDADNSKESTPLNENIYGTDETDAFRRDLTINGLFYDLSTFSVIDYVGGVKDLNDKMIRVVGDPDTRFSEDPVRLTRTIRHAARTGFSIEDATYKSLVENKSLLKQASDVRLYEELKKDLVSGHSFAIIKLLQSTQLLEFLLPEMLEDNGEFLNEDNNSAEIFIRADSLIRNQLEISTTAILAAITLFIGMPKLLRTDIPKRFGSKQDIVKHFEDCFPVLAVPRKECEKLQAIFFAWYDLVNAAPEAIRLNRLRNKDFLPDLIGLFRLIGETKNDHQIIEILENVCSEMDFRGEGHNDREDRDQERNQRRKRSRKRPMKRFM